MDTHLYKGHNHEQITRSQQSALGYRQPPPPIFPHVHTGAATIALAHLVELLFTIAVPPAWACMATNLDAGRIDRRPSCPLTRPSLQKHWEGGETNDQDNMQIASYKCLKEVSSIQKLFSGDHSFAWPFPDASIARSAWDRVRSCLGKRETGREGTLEVASRNCKKIC